jgi:hypothetical protein
MNLSARALLAEIHNKTGADFLATTPLTRYFAEQARGSTKRIEEEN